MGSLQANNNNRMALYCTRICGRKKAHSIEMAQNKTGQIIIIAQNPSPWLPEKTKT